MQSLLIHKYTKITTAHKIHVVPIYRYDERHLDQFGTKKKGIQTKVLMQDLAVHLSLDFYHFVYRDGRKTF